MKEMLMIKWMAVAALTALLAGCATARHGAPVPAPGADTIRFSAGPCFGFCPVYSVTVKPAGASLLTPERNTAVPGETRFTVAPSQYRRLRDSFAPFRPKTGSEMRIGPGENCERAATDLPEYRIVWTQQGQDETQLNFYSGCFDERYARLRAAIAALPQLLEIEAMLKAPAPKSAN
jgi:hypothetical protein